MQLWSARLIASLRPQGFEFTVICPEPETDADEAPATGDDGTATVYRLPMLQALRSGSPAQILGVRRKVSDIYRTHDPQVVHLNFNGLCAFFYPAPGRTPTLLTLHTFWPEYRERADSLLRSHLRSATRVTCVSQALLNWARDAEPVIEDRSACVHHGVVAAGTVPAALAGDPPVVLYVGRLAREKGVDRLLDAFGQVADRVPRAVLVVAGDGPERAALQARAAALGLSARVQFRGWVDPQAVDSLIGESTVVVLPSRSEAFGLVALEAAALARPVVAFAVGGLPEVIEDGVTGRIVDSETPSALAEALVDLLRSPALAAGMGQAARDRVAARFRWSDHCRAYSTLYRQLAGPVPAC